MGIPSYFKYIISNYEIIFKKLRRVGRIDNLYIDSNSIIYDCLRTMDMTYYTKQINDGITIEDVNTTFETDLYNKILEKILFYVKICNPQKRVFVALDGAVPYAKIEQQRQRRYKSAFTKKKETELSKNFDNKLLRYVNNMDNQKLKTHLLQKINLLTEYNYNKFEWDQTAITPGTQFMNKLDDFLTFNLVDNQCDEIKNMNIKILFSGSNQYGEGEHKLYEYIRNIDHHRDNTCVYGLDADLIMLSLNHIHYNRRIYLVREKPSFSNELDNIYDDNELMFMSINHLAKNIVNKMTNYKDVSRDVQLNKIQDYIFISFLLGNDFMPHFPGLNIRINGIEKLFNYYNDTFGIKNTIIKNKKIVWKNLKIFIEKLAKDENHMIIKNTQIHMKEQKRRLKTTYDSCESLINTTIKRISRNNKDNISETIYNIIQESKKKYIENELYNFTLTPTRNRIKEEFINPSKQYWEQRYYYSLFNIDKQFIKRIDETNREQYNNIIKQICKNYLEGLEWCFEYYNFGCKNTKWTYEFAYPPLLSDLYKYTPIFETIFLEKENYHIDPLSQLCYVIPQSAFNLLTPNISESLQRKYGYNYCSNHKFDWAYCKYFWECHVSFPYVNLDDFSDYINSLMLM